MICHALPASVLAVQSSEDSRPFIQRLEHSLEWLVHANDLENSSE